MRARLERLAQRVGLPIDPPQRNVNSRFALETGELIRATHDDDAAGAFHHDISRAFFAEQADISKAQVIIPIAEHHGATAKDVEAAWGERRFAITVDDFIESAQVAGVSGVPAMAWPHRRAVVGMAEPDQLVAMLAVSQPER